LLQDQLLTDSLHLQARAATWGSATAKHGGDNGPACSLQAAAPAAAGRSARRSVLVVNGGGGGQGRPRASTLSRSRRDGPTWPVSRAKPRSALGGRLLAKLVAVFLPPSRPGGWGASSRFQARPRRAQQGREPAQLCRGCRWRSRQRPWAWVGRSVLALRTPAPTASANCCAQPAPRPTRSWLGASAIQRRQQAFGCREAQHAARWLGPAAA